MCRKTHAGRVDAPFVDEGKDDVEEYNEYQEYAKTSRIGMGNEKEWILNQKRQQVKQLLTTDRLLGATLNSFFFFFCDTRWRLMRLPFAYSSLNKEDKERRAGHTQERRREERFLFSSSSSNEEKTSRRRRGRSNKRNVGQQIKTKLKYKQTRKKGVNDDNHVKPCVSVPPQKTARV